MGIGKILKKSIPGMITALEKARPSTNTQTTGMGGMFRKAIPGIISNLQKMTPSTPTSVDVTAEGMKKKNLPRGTTVSYSGIRTSSQGLLTGAKTEKKTLLGG
jgi:hypothetical protein